MKDQEEAQSFATELQMGFEHLVSELLGKRGGGLSESYVVYVTYVDEDGEQCMAWFGAPEQRQIQTMGIVRALTIQSDMHFSQYMSADDSG